MVEREIEVGKEQQELKANLKDMLEKIADG